MRTLRLIGTGGLISYRALFNWATPSLFIGSLLAAPVFQLLFFVLLGRHTGTANDDFYILGNVVLSATGPCVTGGTMAIANERRFGTLGPVLLSPRSRLALWGGRAFPYIGNALLVMVFTLACATVLLGAAVPASALGPLSVALLSAALSGTAFGMVIGSIGLRVRNTLITANVTNTLLILLTGGVVPREHLPTWMDSLGEVLPLTHAIEAARACASGSSDFSVVRGPVLTELALCLAYALLAALLLRFFERSSVRGGTLDTV
ncbi:ABC transporter permease [Streptomyces sp. NPDC058665]|uniref:ABC transporter permease n=1 Tax=Streptomyces sp. NPDC058665 TaxID=3346586 RepID=UPI00365E82D4